MIQADTLHYISAHFRTIYSLNSSKRFFITISFVKTAITNMRIILNKYLSDRAKV